MQLLCNIIKMSVLTIKEVSHCACGVVSRVDVCKRKDGLFVSCSTVCMYSWVWEVRNRSSRSSPSTRPVPTWFFQLQEEDIYSQFNVASNGTFVNNLKASQKESKSLLVGHQTCRPPNMCTLCPPFSCRRLQAQIEPVQKDTCTIKKLNKPSFSPCVENCRCLTC